MRLVEVEDLIYALGDKERKDAYTAEEIRRRTEVIASHDESAMVKAMADIYWLCKEWHKERK